MRWLVLLLSFTAACVGSDVSRTVGARCDDSSECDDRCLLPADGWPGGMCTQICDDDSDCPSETVCVDEEGGVCLYTCGSCEFLGDGWACEARTGKPDGQVMVCVGA
jgi:hypothetical protein